LDNNKYLLKLEKHLKNLPPEDRADAIAYYSEYLNEAGPDGARQAEATLGTPAQVAAGIMADYAMRDMGEGQPKVKKGISAVWFAVIGVFALPIGLPIAIALFCIVLALFIVLFAVLFSLYAAAISVLVSGFATALLGCIILPQGLWSGLFYIGGGLLALGIGIMLFIAVTALTRVSLKGIAKLFNAIRFRKVNKQVHRGIAGDAENANVTIEDGAVSNPGADNANTEFVPGAAGNAGGGIANIDAPDGIAANVGIEPDITGNTGSTNAGNAGGGIDDGTAAVPENDAEIPSGEIPNGAVADSADGAEMPESGNPEGDIENVVNPADGAEGGAK